MLSLSQNEYLFLTKCLSVSAYYSLVIFFKVNFFKTHRILNKFTFLLVSIPAVWAYAENILVREQRHLSSPKCITIHDCIYD